MNHKKQISLFQPIKDRPIDGRPPVNDERPPCLSSATYRLKLPDAVVMLTIADDDSGRPYEFFLNAMPDNAGLSEMLAALSLLGSRMLRTGFSVDKVAKDILAIASPATGHWQSGRYFPSLSSRIGQTLIDHVA